MDGYVHVDNINKIGIMDKYIDKFGKFGRDNDRYKDMYLNKINSENKRKRDLLKDAPNYYVLITNKDNVLDLFNSKIDLPYNEFIKIKSFFPSYYRITYIDYDRKYCPTNADENGFYSYTHDTTKSVKILHKYKMAGKKMCTTMFIWKCPDDYYLFALGDEKAFIFDKCDQIEGIEYLARVITPSDNKYYEPDYD